MPISHVLLAFTCSICSSGVVAAATSQSYPSKPVRLIVPLAEADAPGLVSRRPARGKGVEAAGFYPAALTTSQPYPSRPVRLIVPLAPADAPGLVSRRPARGKGVEAAGFYPVALTTSQPYPSRPVRLIVPLAPGGGMDTIARGIALKLTESLGQTVVVDNRGGGGGSIGAELVAHAAQDGYTLLMMSATGVIHTLMYKAQYDAVRDFAAVSQVTTQPYVIVLTPAIPAKSVTELVAYAKLNPGKLSYASSGNGSLIHLTGELFKSVTGIEMVHIPYKGIAAAYPDLIAGQIQLTFASIISALPMIRAQRLRALAVKMRDAG